MDRPSGPAPSTGEFVALMALTMSLVAMAIDSMLPALPGIAADLDAADPNDRQLVLTLLFAGLTVGQLVYGPLSDAIGRKRAIYVGIGCFVAGGLTCALALSFPMMLVGRALQGFGAAGPRIVTVAMVRDRYEGREMARIMSFISSIFILVPVLAPGIGQLVLIVGHWRVIFFGLVAMAIVAVSWLALRQPETLPRERRNRFAPRVIARGAAECVSNRAFLGYTVASGLIFGAFVAYLATSQQIFQEQYGLGKLFPLAFGAIAASIGVSSLVNARLVMRFSMRGLARAAMTTACALSLAMLAIALPHQGHAPLWLLMPYMLGVFFCSGLVFGNLSALAMAPMGHIAGLAAAVTGSLSSLISVAAGTPVGRTYDGTIVPLVAGFGALYLLALIAATVAEPR